MTPAFVYRLTLRLLIGKIRVSLKLRTCTMTNIVPISMVQIFMQIEAFYALRAKGSVG